MRALPTDLELKTLYFSFKRQEDFSDANVQLWTNSFDPRFMMTASHEKDGHVRLDFYRESDQLLSGYNMQAFMHVVTEYMFHYTHMTALTN